MEWWKAAQRAAVGPSSVPNDIDQVLHRSVSSSMIPTDIVSVLANHGCTNLTASLNEGDCTKYPIANGGLGDVFSGRLLDGTPVAIKTVRAEYDQGKLARVYHKRAAKEIYTWSKCKHPNVVELMGVAVFRESLAMISRWEKNGDLLKYISHHPDADRCQLSKSICAGLAYLHANDIVHGDLKGANVLISQDGTPMLMDFGNANKVDATLQFTQTKSGPSMSLRWTAPEIVRGRTSHTNAGDIYALGMTILEALTGEIPFPKKSDRSVLGALYEKKLPPRPKKIIPEKSISGNILWVILTSCWSYNPKCRPSAEMVKNMMEQLTPATLKEIEDEPEEPEAEDDD